MNFSSSSRSSLNFSLEELVKKNRSPSGMLCAKGGMGGGAAISAAWVLSNHLVTRIPPYRARLATTLLMKLAFLASLKADVEKEIIQSGAKIMNQGRSDPAGFYFEYSEGGIHGRITIGGKKSGTNYYSLEATLNETSSAEGKSAKSAT